MKKINYLILFVGIITSCNKKDTDHKYYISIVSRHTDRLINIVQDLLTIAEMEEVNFKLLKVPSSLDIIINSVLSLYKPKANEKGLYFYYEKNNEIPKIKIDAFRIEQVIINLIDNAISYTDSGGIYVRTYAQNEYVVIEVEDTGCGVSNGDKERIFERFFRADKSRSRKAGGTGLGLSIVKHIILQHQGIIEVDSTISIGTKFTVKLPIEIKEDKSIE